MQFCLHIHHEAGLGQLLLQLLLVRLEAGDPPGLWVRAASPPWRGQPLQRAGVARPAPFHKLQLLATTEGFAANVTGELDSLAEARNLRATATAVTAHPRFVVPQPVDCLTTKRVLVMEWVQGTPITDAAETLGAGERGELARELLACFLAQILVGGTFHADPHPGNLLMQPDGRIALIDCGAIGLLDRRPRSALQAVLVAIAGQDAARLRDALRPITVASTSIDEAALERALSSVLVHQLGPATPSVQRCSSH